MALEADADKLRPFEAPARERKAFLEEASDSRLRLQTSVRLRWFAVAGQLITVTAVYFWLGFELPIGPCILLIAMSAWLNVYLRLRYSPRLYLSPNLATILLAYDMVQLTSLLFLTGGIENPFTVLLVAPVTVSAATLPPRNTLLLGAITLAATTLLVFYHFPLPWYGKAPPSIPILFKAGQLTAVTATLVFLGLYAWRLAKEARQMSAALAATEMVLAREQRLHAIDGLAAAAAHELGTPLGTIALVTKELEREIPSADPHYEDIALLRSQALRCRDILQKLTKRPSEQDPMYATISLKHLIEEAVEPHRVSLTRITVRVEPAAGSVSGTSEPIGERRPGVIYGLGNLIENAVDFASSNVEINATWSEDGVSIVIADDGPGFPPAIIDIIGDPYVTTRPATAVGESDRNGSSGLGLGFFIAKTLLERSGAQITLSNHPHPATGAVVCINWTRAAFEGDSEAWIASAKKAAQPDTGPQTNIAGVSAPRL